MSNRAPVDVLTYSQYVQLENKDPLKLYFCTDNNKFFIGNRDVTDKMKKDDIPNINIVQLICKNCSAPLDKEDIKWENDYPVCKCGFCGTSNIILRKN